ncbi:DUF5336 domain-containing protein [Mycobacterium sp.]|uniref:DUF5336 domain-containing protein n=1 Tax=Mycobacterium sp. TaxID=1785 RepID=UPI003A889C9A
MTYPPGSPGYPPAQQVGSYPDPAAGPGNYSPEMPEGGLGRHLCTAVVVLGLSAYVFSFGPMFNFGFGGSAGGAAGGARMAVVIAVLAALLAGAGLLPKARNYTPIVAVLSVLDVLVIVSATLNKPSSASAGWALWIVLVCIVFQSVAAVGALLLDAGVLTAPVPRPKYGQFGGYGPYVPYGGPPGAYYGQPGAPQSAPNPGPPPASSGYGSAYGGYSPNPNPSSDGLATQPTQVASLQAPQESAHTPPTGFPSFRPPPPVATGTESVGSCAPVDDSSAAEESTGAGPHPESSPGSAPI